MEHKRLKEKLEAILTLPDLPWGEDLTAQDCKQIYDILCKIEQGKLIEFPRITETVYGLEWTVEYVSNMRTGIGIAKVFCGTEEQAKAVLEIVKKYGYPKQEELDKLRGLQE